MVHRHFMVCGFLWGVGGGGGGGWELQLWNGYKFNYPETILISRKKFGVEIRNRVKFENVLATKRRGGEDGRELSRHSD